MEVLFAKHFQSGALPPSLASLLSPVNSGRDGTGGPNESLYSTLRQLLLAAPDQPEEDAHMAEEIDTKNGDVNNSTIQQFTATICSGLEDAMAMLISTSQRT